MPTVIFTSSGTWNAPLAASGTAYVECWAAGGGGGDTDSSGPGGGGGGGEYAREPALAITAGNAYSYTVGAGGAGGSGAAGSAGGNSTFTGDSATVTAHGGSGGGFATGGGSAGAGGTGSSNTVHFDGGHGAAGVTGTGGGGGGSSAGPASAGTPATTSTGAIAPTGGGPGGNGAVPSGGGVTAGTSGSAPGGGGGGGYTGGGCVDTLTEIFTQRGWLRYDQVSEGDHVWAIDTDSGKEKWSLVTLVRIFTGMRDTVVLDTPEGKVVSTPEHRHVVSGYALVTAAEIDTSYQLTGEKAALPVTGLEKGQADTVWCPTTEHSTWLAKRGSLIFFTGNKP